MFQVVEESGVFEGDPCKHGKNNANSTQIDPAVLSALSCVKWKTFYCRLGLYFFSEMMCAHQLKAECSIICMKNIISLKTCQKTNIVFIQYIQYI